MKYLDPAGKFASGNVRFYYRRAGKRTPMPDLPPDHPKFIAAYARIHGSKPAPDSRTGTIAAGVDAYLASDTFLALRASTRDTRRRQVQKIKADRGRATIETLEPRHIRKDLSPFPAGAALNRWKAWRALGRFWVDSGLLDRDPARDVTKPRLPRSEGYAPFTRDDMQTFRDCWPIGTMQRLAFEVAYQSCAAAVDLVRLGPANMRDGWLSYTRSKSGTVAETPIANPPAWFEPSPHLKQCLDAAPKHLTWLTTKAGAARSAKSVSSWFSRACTEAGLPELSLHGLRKGRAAMFRENGATPDQRMAILGHETEGETHHYSKSADLRRIISGTEKCQIPNPLPKTGNFTQ